jgi:tRNA:m4X modification enzyme
MDGSIQEPTCCPPTPVSTVSGTEVQILLAKLDRASPYLPTTLAYQDLASPYATMCTTTPTAKQHRPPKHLLQLESIVNHLDAHGLLQHDATYVEFGCGTAKLSDCISERLGGRSSHLLIDRKAFSAERKRDGAMVARKSTVHRVTMDIADVQLDVQLDTPTSWQRDGHAGAVAVGVSKHLCGPAADLTMACLAPRTIPLVVATCCHHLCRLDNYCNTDFVVHQLGFTEREFDVLRIISGWASIKVKKVPATASPLHEEPFPPPVPTEPLPQDVACAPTMSSDEFERTYSREEKQRLGKRCKVVLDTGRAHHLVSLGYSVRLVQYTSLSMENHLLIATPVEKQEKHTTDTAHGV